MFYVVGHTDSDVANFLRAHKKDFDSYKVVLVAPFETKMLKRKTFEGLYVLRKYCDFRGKWPNICASSIVSCPGF